jgi:hypothetical protein
MILLDRKCRKQKNRETTRIFRNTSRLSEVEAENEPKNYRPFGYAQGAWYLVIPTFFSILVVYQI